MTPALHALAVELRDSGKLRWFDGMQYVEPSRRCRRPTCEKHRDLPEFDPGDTYRDRHRRTAPAVVGAIPDFDDPLTAAGALLVARAAWNDPLLHVDPHRDGDDVLRWTVRGRRDGASVILAYGAPTELEALIAAILAAPEKK